MVENRTALRAEIIRRLNPEGLAGFRIRAADFYNLFEGEDVDFRELNLGMQYLLDGGLVAARYTEVGKDGVILPDTFELTAAGMQLRK